MVSGFHGKDGGEWSGDLTKWCKTLGGGLRAQFISVKKRRGEVALTTFFSRKKERHSSNNKREKGEERK